MISQAQMLVTSPDDTVMGREGLALSMAACFLAAP